ncbi:hypothetical protein BH11MYX2_BH11MYX2_26370 [soil metagenome]
MNPIYEKTALDPGSTWFFLMAIFGLLAWVVIASLARSIRRNRMAASAEASVGEHPPALVEGSDVVLCGVVRHYEDELAVKVSITQHGTETESSGSWSYRWEEINREIKVAPFMLDLPNKESVVVRPPRNPEVADALDQKVWINRNQRILSAELVPGETIWVRGRLERSDRADPAAAYRDVKWGWALQPVHGKMLLSSEPLGAGFRSRARFHRAGMVYALIVVAACAVTVVPFLFRVAGHTERAVVEGTNEWITTDDDNKGTTHYGLQFRSATTGHESEEIDSSDAGAISKGDEVPVRVSSESNWQLGPEASLRWWHLMLMAALSLITAFWYRIARQKSRPWHKRQVNETGGGRLPDPQ